MRTRFLSLALMAIPLTACSPAKAGPVDPTNVVHCNIMLHYFYAGAVKKNDDLHLIRELRARHHWYMAKVREQPNWRQAIMGSDPVLKALQDHSDQLVDELQGCLDRQNDDPTFKAMLGLVHSGG